MEKIKVELLFQFHAKDHGAGDVPNFTPAFSQFTYFYAGEASNVARFSLCFLLNVVLVPLVDKQKGSLNQMLQESMAS